MTQKSVTIKIESPFCFYKIFRVFLCRIAFVCLRKLGSYFFTDFICFFNFCIAKVFIQFYRNSCFFNIASFYKLFKSSMKVPKEPRENSSSDSPVPFLNHLLIKQKQHIELTRDLAIRVNHFYGKDTFVVPEGRFMKEGARIMALDDPTSKMSKSAPNVHSRISLLDDNNKIKKSIMKATTDSDGVVRFDVENKPGISNLLTIYSVLSGTSIPDLEKQYEGHGYGDFKKDLVDVTVEALTPIRERFAEIRESDELIEALKDGRERADAIAQVTLKRVREAFGLGI